MLGINNQRVWCRRTEEKIIEAFLNGANKKISVRDSIINNSNSVFYKLWNTNIVKSSKDDIYIYIASNQEEIDRYYHPSPFSTWSRRDYIISNTTKSRLNAFLSYYGFNSLEVHSSMKEWNVKYNGKELDLDCWYKLDLKTKELVKE